MGLLAPLALIGLVAVPIIVAFYMLRLRRPEQPVSSTYLWQQLVRDVEANAPWQKLRRSLLLLLQLLLAVLLAFVVARPFSEHPAGLARDLVLVIDASASMSATDVFPDRLTAAKRIAREQLAQVPSDGRVSLIAAGDTARVVANEATDRGRISQAIESIQASTSASDLTDALKLANSLAKRARGAEVLVVTDDASSTVPAVALEVPVRVLTVGRERDNQAIAALAVRADPSGLKRTLFVSVANYSTSIVARRLQIIADGTAVTARDLLLDPLTRADVVIDELPVTPYVTEAGVQVSIEGGEPYESISCTEPDPGAARPRLEGDSGGWIAETCDLNVQRPDVARPTRRLVQRPARARRAAKESGRQSVVPRRTGSYRSPWQSEPPVGMTPSRSASLP